MASITTLEKKKYAKELLEKATETEWIAYVWLGGSDAQAEGNWTWSDNSLWEFENWYRTEPSNKKKENCLKMRPHDGVWWDDYCTRRYRPLCDKEMHVFKGTLNRTWTFLPEQVPQQIVVVFESDLAMPHSKRTGVSLSWTLEAGHEIKPKPYSTTTF